MWQEPMNNVDHNWAIFMPVKTREVFPVKSHELMEIHIGGMKDNEKYQKFNIHGQRIFGIT